MLDLINVWAWSNQNLLILLPLILLHATWHLAGLEHSYDNIWHKNQTLEGMHSVRGEYKDTIVSPMEPEVMTTIWDRQRLASVRNRSNASYIVHKNVGVKLQRSHCNDGQRSLSRLVWWLKLRLKFCKAWWSQIYIWSDDSQTGQFVSVST